MIRRPPRSTRTDTLFPYTTLFRSTELQRADVDAERRMTASFPAAFADLEPFAEPWIGLDTMAARSEEHTSELQSLMRISYAVFCLKKKKEKKGNNTIVTYDQIKYVQ